uniref:Uncharacterized protein n=1 Tax=Arundo donax TaxID=35708 RepID=A0A0A9D851_ARUDO
MASIAQVDVFQHTRYLILFYGILFLRFFHDFPILLAWPLILLCSHTHILSWNGSAYFTMKLQCRTAVLLYQTVVSGLILILEYYLISSSQEGEYFREYDGDEPDTFDENQPMEYILGNRSWVLVI